MHSSQARTAFYRYCAAVTLTSLQRMAAINSILRERLQQSLHVDSHAEAERALAEILENHRVAGHTVREGIHDGRPAWHVLAANGDPYAVFWISDADEGLSA